MTSWEVTKDAWCKYDMCFSARVLEEENDWIVFLEVHRQTDHTKASKVNRIVCNMEPCNIFRLFCVDLIHLVVLPWKGYTIVCTQHLDLIHRNSVVMTAGKILEWAQSSRCRLAKHVSRSHRPIHVALMQPCHRLVIAKQGSQERAGADGETDVGRVAKKLDFLKYLFHSNPSVLNQGDTSVTWGHGTENGYNWSFFAYKMPALWQAFHGPNYSPLPRSRIGYHGNAAINMLIV